jgi:tRNA(fMet)-specific endonuclease VapC
VAVSRYCLDTSAYSHFKRGDPAVAELLDSAEWIGVPSVVLGELWIGFVLGAQLDRNQAELREFLAAPVVEELPVDRRAARIYAEIVIALRRAGTPLPTNDLWVAATAAAAGATVLTYDAHFERIARVGSLVLPTPPAASA